VLRALDDLVDEDKPQAPERVEAVENWANGQPTVTPETRILDELSQRHRLPADALIDFCHGMRHDIARAVIHTEEDLERYCQQAGGSVGVMLAHIFGARDGGAEKMATLGRAMQRTNILRDIDDDAAHGRLYIARTTIDHFAPPLPGARANLMRDQIARADRLYEDAADAAAFLPRGKRAMKLTAALYREILRQIERDGLGRTAGRTVLPAWRKRLLIGRHRLAIPAKPSPNCYLNGVACG
jgi:phytoene synthase